MKKSKSVVRVGTFGIGHRTYWEQFEGLLPTLMGYHDTFKNKLIANGVEVLDFGMVDDSLSAFAALERLQKEKLDVLFVNMLTYGPSCTFAPFVRETKLPIVLVGLQPLGAMDYSKASTRMQLENDNVCSVPEFTGVAVRMGRKVNDVILGKLNNDKIADNQIAEWCDIAKVLNSLRGARLGHMGHVLESMYDMHADLTSLSATFGIHSPLIEPDDLVACYREVKQEEIELKKKEILSVFETPDPKVDPVTRKLTSEDLEIAARTFAAMEKLIEKESLDGMAYYYEGEPDSLVRQVVSSVIVGNTILQGKGFPICGEADIKTCVAMLIMDRLKMGGSFAEFHPFDFDENFILVGHDGPHHVAIADGKPILRSLIKYHGKVGSGASVEFKLKEGPITMLGITVGENGKTKFVIGEGESVRGAIPATGNTNTRGFFGNDVRDYIRRWVMEGPTHHYALGIGHRAETLKKIATILNIECVIVR
jgi:L-arabinose isomerase